MSHYDTLQVAKSASPEVLRAAFLALSREWSPDRHPSDLRLAASRMMEINNAFAVLSDPESRARYDASLGFTRAPDLSARWVPSRSEAPTTEPVRQRRRGIVGEFLAGYRGQGAQLEHEIDDSLDRSKAFTLLQWLIGMSVATLSGALGDWLAAIGLGAFVGWAVQLVRGPFHSLPDWLRKFTVAGAVLLFLVAATLANAIRTGSMHAA